MHVYSGGHEVQCLQVLRTNPMGHSGSIYRTKCAYKEPIVWAYGDTMQNNPIGTQGTCVYKGPNLRGSDAQIDRGPIL